MSAPERFESHAPFEPALEPALERALERARARHLEGAAAAAGDAAPDLAAIRARIERPAPNVRRWPRIAAAALAAGALIALALRVTWPATDVRPGMPAPIADGPGPVVGNGAPPEHAPAVSANTELVAERVRAALSDLAARTQPDEVDPLLVRAQALDEALADLRAEGWPIARWVERVRDDARLDSAARLLANDYLALRGDRTQLLALPSGHRLLAAALDSAGMRALFTDRAAARAACSELERAGPTRAAASLRHVLETLPERRLGPTARDELLAQLARCGAPGARALLELSLSSSVAHEALETALLGSSAAHDVLAQSTGDERALAIEARFLLRCLAKQGVAAALPFAERASGDPLLEDAALACIAAIPTPEALLALLRVGRRQRELDLAPALVRLLRAEPELGRRALALPAFPREGARALLGLCDRAGDGAAARCALALAADTRLDAAERERAVELGIELGSPALLSELRALYEAPGASPRLRASCLVGATRLSGAASALEWLAALPRARRERIAAWLSEERALTQPITTVSRIERELTAPPPSVSL